MDRFKNLFYKKDKRVGLTLGGGGARGLAEISYLRVLDELGIRPSIISGTSMGAILGAFYASGMSGKAIYELLENIGLIDLAQFIDPAFFRRSSLLKGKAIENFFWKHLPARRFEDLQIPLKVVATDYWYKEQVVFEKGDLISAIRASMAIPGVFEPVVIGDMVLTDGGSINPVPHDLIREHCDYLIAIDVTGDLQPQKHAHVPTIFDNVMSAFQTMEASINATKRKLVHVDLYAKPKLTNIGVLDFVKEKHIFEMIEPDVAAFKEQLVQDFFLQQ